MSDVPMTAAVFSMSNPDGYSVQEFIDRLQKTEAELMAQGWRDLRIECVIEDGYYDGRYIVFGLAGRRPETEQETAARLTREQELENSNKKYRQQQYEALKKEFESTPEKT